jgi:AraC-like DNA-binding protein
MATPSDLLPHLRRARDLMDSCYADDLDVASVAQRAGVSKYHFIRSFSAEYGQTPRSTLRTVASNAPRTCCVPQT